MASYFDKICDIATEWTWDQLFPLSLKNVEKKQSSKTAWPRQGCRNEKPQKCLFLGHPICSWLHFCACFSLIMWSPGPRCTAVEANFGGRQGDRGQARPLARLCRPPAPPPTDLLDNPEVDLALAACRWPAPALAWQTLLASPTSPLPLGPPPPPPPSPTSSPPL